MSAKFVRVHDRELGELLVNVGSIAWVHEQSRTICVFGVSGTGDGLVHVRKDEMGRLVEMLPVVQAETGTEAAGDDGDE